MADGKTVKAGLKLYAVLLAMGCPGTTYSTLDGGKY
jgi:hypothetical protein